VCRLLGYSGPALALNDLLLTSNNALVNQARTDQGYHPGEPGERQAVDGDLDRVGGSGVERLRNAMQATVTKLTASRRETSLGRS
jgi:hypothetical protein